MSNLPPVCLVCKVCKVHDIMLSGRYVEFLRAAFHVLYITPRNFPSAYTLHTLHAMCALGAYLCSSVNVSP